KPSRRDLVWAPHNPGPPSRRSPPGVGAWRYSRSAQTAVCAAKPRPISAGHRPRARSRGGSPTNSRRPEIASYRVARASVADVRSGTSRRTAMPERATAADPDAFDRRLAPPDHHVDMNPLAIPTAHGHIALAARATPRVAAYPEGAASARKAQKAEGRALARSSGCVVLKPGIHAALHICA